jgi:hypothetical protein
LIEKQSGDEAAPSAQEPLANRAHGGAYQRPAL